jgi:catechol 2,3-dioxygenase-like lactoylglutathione lyase family enzyme
MTSVQGVGGVFVYSNDAAKLANWYRAMLGIEMEAHPDGDKYFKVFFTRDAESSALRENPVFAIYQAQAPLAESGRGFMLNLRTNDLARLLEQLRTRGVEVESNTLEWLRGKHAWIRDCDGNRVELYEEII